MRIEAETAARQGEALPLGTWPTYLLCAIGTGLILLVAYLGTLASLARADILPPPPIVNNLCADAKLEFLRDHPVPSPDLLTIGSSVAWRNIDSNVLAQDGFAPLNAGFCAAQANQAGFVANFFTHEYPTVRTVLGLFVPHDFRGCDQTPTRLFDRSDAANYLFDRGWLYWLYLRYFDPVSLVRNARRLGEHLVDLRMDAFADGPLERVGQRPTIYQGFGGFDQSCFDALHALALDMRAGGRRLVVATSPLNADWTRRYDPDRAIEDAFTIRIEQALAGTGAAFWDGARAFRTTPDNFTDNALHLEQPVAARFTEALAQAIAATGDRP